MENNVLGLYPHNIEAYEKIDSAYKSGQNVVGIVHATGTGKSFLALQLALDNKDKKITWLVPSIGIAEHIKKIIDDNPNIDMERYFPDLTFKTYQSYVDKSKEEIAEEEINLLILDEFHHIGAPVWGSRVNTIIETHSKMKVFGMTAYTVRDRKTPYERDMANPETDELFSRRIVSRYDLCDAMIDGIIPKPIYKSSHVNLKGFAKELKEKIDNMSATNEEVKEFEAILKSIEKRIAEAPGVKEMAKKNIKPDGKWIYCCPTNSEDGVNDIETIKAEAMEWFKEIVPEEDIVFYTTTSEMGEEGKKNREAFYDDKTLDGKDAKGKLRVMFAINQYNEGIHAPNVDGVIMGRGTNSDIIFYEQLGRALNVRGNTKEKYDEYRKYTRDDLAKMCQERDIDIELFEEKDSLIEKLISPVIIDLADNYTFIAELQNNLKDRIQSEYLRTGNLGNDYYLINSDFDIEIINHDIFKMLMDLKERLNYNFDLKCEEYFSIIETEEMIPTQFDTRSFKDGTKVSYFWHANREKIVKLINNDEVNIKYPKTFRIINEEYNRYLKTKNINKYEEFLIIIEREKIFPAFSSTLAFSDGSIVINFWSSHRKEIFEEACKIENKKKYPKAYKIIVNEYKKYINNTMSSKYQEYFELVEKEGKLPSYGDQRKFRSGRKIGSFRGNYVEEIYLEIQKEENKTKYPKAYKIIVDDYIRIKKGYKHTKIEEYFQIIESDGAIPKQSDTRRFKDGTKVAKFWATYVETIYYEINQKENKTKYPKAYEIINKAYQQYLTNKNINKIEEFLTFVNTKKRLPKSREEERFSNNDSLYDYWKNHSENIYEQISEPKNKEKYPVAYSVIKAEFLKIEKAKNYDKLEEYFVIVNNDGEVPRSRDRRQFSNGDLIGGYWNFNRKKIYERIQEESNKEKYPIAYEAITKAYLVSVAKIERNNIIKTCLELNIDSELNKEIINQLTYDEFISKVLFLQNHNLSLIDESGYMHEIFSMSSANMKLKYGLTLEELVGEYNLASDMKRGG